MRFSAGDGSGESSGKDYVRLKGGESVVGLLRGDPVHWYSHWIGNSTVRCPGKEACQHCQAGLKAAFRFKMNMIVKEKEAGGLAVKIFENGWNVYQALKELNGGGWDLETTRIRISRTGSGKNDTVYSVVPMPNGTLSPEDLRFMESLKLHDFTVTDAAKGDPREPGEDRDPPPSEW